MMRTGSGDSRPLAVAAATFAGRSFATTSLSRRIVGMSRRLTRLARSQPQEIRGAGFRGVRLRDDFRPDRPRHGTPHGDPPDRGDLRDRQHHGEPDGPARPVLPQAPQGERGEDRGDRDHRHEKPRRLHPVAPGEQHKRAIRHEKQHAERQPGIEPRPPENFPRRQKRTGDDRGGQNPGAGLLDQVRAEIAQAGPSRCAPKSCPTSRSPAAGKGCQTSASATGKPRR